MASFDTDGLYSLWNDDVGNRFNSAAVGCIGTYAEKKRDFEEKKNAARAVSRNKAAYSSFSARIDSLKVD